MQTNKIVNKQLKIISLILALWVNPQSLFAIEFEVEQDLFLGNHGLGAKSTQESEYFKQINASSIDYQFEFLGGIQSDKLKSNSTNQSISYDSKDFQVEINSRQNYLQAVLDSNEYLKNDQSSEVNIAYRLLNQKYFEIASQLAWSDWNYQYGGALKLKTPARPEHHLELQLNYHPQKTLDEFQVDDIHLLMKSKDEIWNTAVNYYYNKDAFHASLGMSQSWIDKQSHYGQIQLNNKFNQQTMGIQLQHGVWKLNTAYTRLNREINLKGSDIKNSFAQVKYELENLELSAEGTFGGAHFLIAELDAPIVLNNWNLNPAYYPKEGVESFWFLLQNIYYKLGGNFRMAQLKPFIQHEFIHTNWKIKPVLSYSKTWMYAQVLKEEQEIWLFLIPLDKTYFEIDSQLIEIDLMTLSTEFCLSIKAWELGIELSQVIPIILPEVDFEYQEWGEESRESLNNSGQSNTPVVPDEQPISSESQYNWGEGLRALISIKYFF